METKAKKKISKDNVLIFFLKNRALLLVLIFFILLSVASKKVYPTPMMPFAAI